MIPIYFAEINETIEQFAAAHFILDASVTFDIRPGNQGYLTGSVIFEDFSSLHFKEFVDAAPGIVEKLSYSYHYQEADETLVFRYDNARHKPAIAFREHKHTVLGTISEALSPALGDVLIEIIQLKGWV